MNLVVLHLLGYLWGKKVINSLFNFIIATLKCVKTSIYITTLNLNLKILKQTHSTYIYALQMYNYWGNFLFYG